MLKKSLWHIVVIALATVYLFPLGWMAVSSLHDPRLTTGELLHRLTHPFRNRSDEAIPTWRPENYREAILFGQERMATGDAAPGTFAALWRSPFRKHLVNTLVIEALGVTGMVMASALAAYGFARIRWPGRNVFFVATVATMMLPFAVQLVPLYALYRRLGWIGSLKPLWAPAWFGGAFSIFLLRQFFMRIPNELTDAARIDGCSEFDIFLRIVLPLSKPALVVVGLFHFMYCWNDFFAPLVFLTKPEDFTLALGLHSFQSAHGGTPWHLLMAAATLIVIPVVVLYFFTQRFFMRGIRMTGVKE
jgi:multiple sugar transport system permease protein